jgi:hypothetical protein
MITGLGAAVSPLAVGEILDAVSSSWYLEAFGMRFDIFQAILVVAGLLMLLVIGLLYFVENVHPKADRAAEAAGSQGAEDTPSSQPGAAMEYRIMKRSGPPAESDEWDSTYWSDVPVLRVDQFREESSDHRPRVEVKVTHSQDAMHLFYRVQDRYVRAVHTKPNSMVCKDSCAEFFVQPRGRGPYINFEINCGGTMLAAFVEDPTRPDMHSPLAKSTPLTPELASQVKIRTSLPKTVDPEIGEPTEWTLRYTVPLSVFEHYVGDLGSLGGQTWRANFFKCGDGTSHPHWASWAPVGGGLNFHQPEYFKPIIFEP